MFLTNLFKLSKKCSHEMVLPNQEVGYCPDCGKLIENQWYITRCACCGVKLVTTSRNEEVFPRYRYCSNCGSSEYLVEKLDSINFIDINFAVLIKKVIEEEVKVNTTQCWQERTTVKPKLLVQYL